MDGLTDAQRAEIAAEAEERSRELTILLTAGDEDLRKAGFYPVSVAHGTPETQAAADLLYKMLPALAEECGPPVFTRGGNEYTTYFFRGPGAADAARRFAYEAAARGESWWKVTPTGLPQYR